MRQGAIPSGNLHESVGTDAAARVLRIKPVCLGFLAAATLLIMTAGSPAAAISGLAESYRFLVSDRAEHGGALYTATAGALKGRALPLSFYDSPAYWGAHVCGQPGISCAVNDIYNPSDYTLLPQPGPAAELQTERANVHNGSNIYDGAVWQIAVVLGEVAHHFENPAGVRAYSLADNQNRLLKQSHGGDATVAVEGSHRAVTAGRRFLYNGQAVSDADQAYSFRMIARNWLSVDPLAKSRYAYLIRTTDLPGDNPEYRSGRVSWSDWKPITGENAWAFLLGPLQAAYIHYVLDRKKSCIPFADLSIQNALSILPTFAAMQSAIGAVYYAPCGTIANQGGAPVDPYQVSVENNFSLYAGLTVLQAALEAQHACEKGLRFDDQKAVERALGIIHRMIHGGQSGQKKTEGLMRFFKDRAWREGAFAAGGLADKPHQPDAWMPALETKAVDATTWGVAALGAKQIDEWFGFGAAYRSWRQIKRWGAYGVGTKLWGVGYSDQDGNGMTPRGAYRQGILSAEWTAGAITMLRSMTQHYQTIADSAIHRTAAQRYVQELKKDEDDMLAGIQKLRFDFYKTTDFPGKPEDYPELITLASNPYLYASRRALIPFGWYANPIPSTCATAWIILIASRYNPFGYAGKNN